MLRDLDVVIEAGLALLPLGVDVGLDWQRTERRTVELVE